MAGYTGAPSTSTSDAVRLLIGDTASTSILTDAEIAYFLSLNSNTHLAAALACRAIAAEYAGSVNYSLGELSESDAQKYEHWISLAKELETAYKSGIAGGSGFTSTTPAVATVYDSGTQPKDYEVSGEAHPDWSLNEDDQPTEVRGIEQ